MGASKHVDVINTDYIQAFDRLKHKIFKTFVRQVFVQTS